jgi:hypothetical protein
MNKCSSKPGNESNSKLLCIALLPLTFFISLSMLARSSVFTNPVAFRLRRILV